MIIIDTDGLSTRRLRRIDIILIYSGSSACRMWSCHHNIGRNYIHHLGPKVFCGTPPIGWKCQTSYPP